MREEEDGVVHTRRHRRKLTKAKGKGALVHPSPVHRSSYGHYADPSPPPRPSSPSAPTISKDHPAPEGHRIVEGARDLLHAITGNEENAQRAEAERRKKEEQSRLPPDAVDLVVEDKQAEEEEMVRDRRRGEPGGKKKKVYRQTYTSAAPGEYVTADTLASDSGVEGLTLEVKDTVVEEGLDGEETEVVRLIVREDDHKALHVSTPDHLRHGSEDTNPWS